MSSIPPARPLLARAFGLALALPLVCVVLVSALVVGQQLRDARSGTPEATAEPPAQAAAAPVAADPMQFIELPASVNADNITASPDGRYLIASADNYTRRLLLRVEPTSIGFRKTTAQVADVTEIYLGTWLPDSSGFVGHSRSPLPPQPGAPAKMKTYDVFVVATDGSKALLGAAQSDLKVSADGKWIGGLDGDGALVAFARDGSGTKVLGRSDNSVSLLGWDGDTRLGHIVWSPVMELRRVGLDGMVTKMPFAPDLRAGGQATWSPDHRAALVTAIRANGETPGLLTDRLTTLPAGAFQTWVGPHELLWRAADGRLGTLDALTGATRTLTAKMKSDKVRILGTSAPYTLWIDETAGRLHITDLGADRDTTLGVNPIPERAQPLTGGRFLFTRVRDFTGGKEKEIGILDGAGWFAQIPPTPAPIPVARDQSGVPTGLVRAESRDGGWSVVYPSTWFRRAQPMRGSDFLSYEPELDFSGNLPPAGEVRVVVQLVSNFDELDPRAYASTTPRAGNVTQERDVTIAGQPGYTNTVNMGSPPPWPAETRNWFVRSPYFKDRMLVIQATPADARTKDVEAIVASLRFAPPVVAQQTPVSRAQVTAKYAAGTFPVLRLDGLEAKLVTWKEYELAAGGFHSGVNDPEQLIWLVLVTGEIAHPRGGPQRLFIGESPPPTTPPTYPWILYIVDAISGDGFGLSCCGPDARPKWFDRLSDRAK